jgi:hypothetical protein
MKQTVLVGTLIAALAIPAVPLSAQTKPQAGGTSLGSVTLNRRVMADGKPLPLGTYQVRLSADAPKPGVGQSPDSERYVEFVRGGKVVAREVASVVSAEEIAQIAEGRRPAPGTSRVELLKGNDYVRVWINRAGTHYLIHFPAAS